MYRLDLALEVCIPDDMMWSLIDGKHIVTIPYHDRLLVGSVNDDLDNEIDMVTADFGM